MVNDAGVALAGISVKQGGEAGEPQSSLSPVSVHAGNDCTCNYSENKETNHTGHNEDRPILGAEDSYQHYADHNETHYNPDVTYHDIHYPINMPCFGGCPRGSCPGL